MIKQKPSRLGVAVILVTVSQATTTVQNRPHPVVANPCDVVESPAEYRNKVLTMEGILLPGDHSVSLFSPSCDSKDGFHQLIDAVLPDDWESSANGKKLKRLFQHGKRAKVSLTGVFRTGNYSYGPDGAKFQLSISEILSVEKAPPDAYR
jgi:hypothetical protein